MATITNQLAEEVSLWNEQGGRGTFDDIGRSWTDLGTIVAGGTNVYSLCYLGNGIVLAGTGNGEIARSTDYGRTWTNLGVIPVGGGPQSVASLCYLGNGIVLAGTFNGKYLARSTDYGLTWVDLGPIVPIGVGGGGILSLCYLGNGIALAGVGGGMDGQIARSTDYGLTWTDIGINFGIMLPALCYLGNGIALAGSEANDHIWYSKNNGLTWEDRGGIGSGGYPSKFCYLGNGIVLAGFMNTGKIARSTDFGLTWMDCNVTWPVFTFHVHILVYVGSGTVLASCDTMSGPQIARSTDYGLTWTEIGGIVPGEMTVQSLCYLGGGIVLAGTSPNCKIARSTGYTKSPFETGVKDRSAILCTAGALTLDAGHSVLVASVGASTNVTLPDALTCVGRKYIIKNANMVANLGILPDAGDTIDGVVSVTLGPGLNYVLEIISDGANWRTLRQL